MTSTFWNAADAAIYAKLTAATALTSLTAGGTASPSIHRILAPEGSDLPYVVFNAQSPSVPVRTLSRVAYENALFQVKGVTLSHSAALAGTIAAEIDAALDGPPLTITGYGHTRCSREQDIDYAEVAAGGQVYQHRGALYRVWSEPS